MRMSLRVRRPLGETCEQSSIQSPRVYEKGRSERSCVDGRSTVRAGNHTAAGGETSEELVASEELSE